MVALFHINENYPKKEIKTERKEGGRKKECFKSKEMVQTSKTGLDGVRLRQAGHGYQWNFQSI